MARIDFSLEVSDDDGVTLFSHHGHTRCKVNVDILAGLISAMCEEVSRHACITLVGEAGLDDEDDDEDILDTVIKPRGKG